MQKLFQFMSKGLEDLGKMSVFAISAITTISCKLKYSFLYVVVSKKFWIFRISMPTWHICKTIRLDNVPKWQV